MLYCTKVTAIGEYTCNPSDYRNPNLILLPYAGGTMSLLSRMYRLGRSTVHEALDETCPAIYSVLKDDYLKVRS